MKYFNPQNTTSASGKYGGNITEIDWKTATDNVLRRYDYQYDALNRLKKGIYSEPGSSVPQNDFYNEAMSYDLNGNISSLQRNAKGEGTAQQIDNLIYTYTGNRLQTVVDNTGNYMGYPDSSGSAISYDDNGNMTDHIDKGILEIKYNYLNLPGRMKFSTTYIIRNNETGENEIRNVRSEYTYRADGTKLRKKYITVFSKKNSTERTTTTDYLDGFQYTINYLNAVSLDFVPTSEGYYDFKNNKYIYNYTDQLGNVRLSYQNNGSGAAVLEENNYYPFGLKHWGYNSTPGNPDYRYQYNGKELQDDTGMLDYGWRQYMPELGRWGVVDPLAEQMRRHSPYNYAFNNPANVIDPDGRLPSRLASFYGKNSAFNWEFDPTTSVSGLAWNERYSGSNFMADDEASGSFMSFFMTNNSISGFTVRGYMAGAMFQSIMSGVSSIDSILGGFNSLRDELINGGFGSNPEKTKAVYESKDALLEKIPSLAELFKITKATFDQNTSINSPALTRGTHILINMNKIDNILYYAFTLGHEMYGHAFANRFFKERFSEITRVSDANPRSFLFFQEAMGLSWEVSVGETRYGDKTTFEAASYYYGPRGQGHEQGIMDKVHPHFNRLMYEWKIIYNIEKNKIK